LVPILNAWIYTKIKEHNKDFEIIPGFEYKKAILNVRIPKTILPELIKELTGEIQFKNIPLIQKVDRIKYKILKNKVVERRIKRLNHLW